MCEDSDSICKVPDHDLCEECYWCPCLEDLHLCDTFFEDAYLNGFGAG